MARVVCQVLPRTNRITLLWSDGTATFPPYALDGDALAELHRLAGQAQNHLAHLGAVASDPAAAAKAGYQLASAGHGLCRLVFQLDRQGAAPGKQVHSWLEPLTREGAVHQLDVLGDCFTLPWAALYDQPPDQAVFAGSGTDGDCWKSFWGRRHPPRGGRRAPRVTDDKQGRKPTVVLAMDPVIRGNLPPEEQLQLRRVRRQP